MAKPKFELNHASQGDDARERPMYGIPEAAHYLLLPRATLRSWVLGRYYSTERGKRHFKPVISLPNKRLPLLSFFSLVEAHVLSAFRRQHRIPLPAIRRAVAYIASRGSSAHPLIEREFETDGAALFIRELGRLIDVSADGQMVMTDVVASHLNRIERDSSGTAIRLYPFTRQDGLDDPKWIVIDPCISFGRPALRGTRIPTAVLAERYKAGDSIDELVHDYGRPRLEIEEAIRCELRAEAA
ncbi:MAG TPA: DUF433 domain-containing protein [Pirellulales bacterium]|nr:DUF433 domain-containing protein [Pirellulales bacterium]